MVLVPSFPSTDPLGNNLRGKALSNMPSAYIWWMVFRFPPFPSTFFYSKHPCRQMALKGSLQRNRSSSYLLCLPYKASRILGQVVVAVCERTPPAAAADCPVSAVAADAFQLFF